jgi:hypothetical protein
MDSGANHGSAEATVISVGLKDSSGGSLIDLAGPWTTWNGEPTELTFNGEDLVVIPGSTTDNLVLGVQRIDAALTEGAQYTLTLGASSGAVILFPFSDTGELIVLPGVNGLAMARSGQDLTFTAPAGITG